MLSLISPAKINLFLRILRRRPDGYHELASLFQAIDLHDILQIEVSDRDLLTCSDRSLPVDHTNLVSKAVHLFRSKTGISKKFVIHLQKNIPQQAGLGGGSSNAATTLWALNALCGNAKTAKELATWGAEIGSDVSFFLSQGTAYCTGRGEILREVAPLEHTSLWIVKPEKGLSTPLVYGKLNASQLKQRDPEEALSAFLSGTPRYFNDLEHPAFEVMPELAALKQKLFDGEFTDVLMSGSGSSFFCIGNGTLPDLPGCSTFKTEFVRRQPDGWYNRVK